MADMTATLGAQSAVGTVELGATAGAASASGGMNETKQLETSVKESMTLIDRFYNGGNRARPAAMDILVMVLDSVVRRMREQFATKQKFIEDSNANLARLDEKIASVQPKRDKLAKELAEKKARAAVLKEAIAKGEGTINDSVSVAREALERAQRLSRNNEKADIATLKLSVKGYDSKGRALPGRDLNLRKKEGGPAARRPGDMLKTDDAALMARVNSVLEK